MPDSVDYRGVEAPAPGKTLEVANGVHWLRMPLPFRLDHINLWLLEDGDGWVIVDTGLFDPQTIALWEGVFAGILAGRPVTRIVVTHFHPDHVGMAGWLCERLGVGIWMTQVEWLWARATSIDIAPTARQQRETFLRAAGCAAELIAATRDNGMDYAQMVSPIPQTYRRLRGGMKLTIGGRDWEIIIGTGHAPEHACLYCAELDLLIAGDQVLPRITPIVAVHAGEPDENPLADFLDSLAMLRRRLPADTYVLPSHNIPFAGLHGRLDYLKQHHGERLDEFHANCVRPMSAWELSQTVFTKPLDSQNVTFALGETIAHLNYLMARGSIARTARHDGVLMYRRTNGEAP
jgi:glyoxylase-like metal-dependent hydrolase (beta-lactamase superfamily II)